MKEGGFVCVVQVGRGWHCELVPMFDDRMGEEGGRGEGRGGGGCMGPAALKYLLSKEKERWKEGRRGSER